MFLPFIFKCKLNNVSYSCWPHNTVQHIKILLEKKHTEEFAYVFCSQGIARNEIFTSFQFSFFSYADSVGLHFISWFGLNFFFFNLKKKWNYKIWENYWFFGHELLRGIFTVPILSLPHQNTALEKTENTFQVFFYVWSDIFSHKTRI